MSALVERITENPTMSPEMREFLYESVREQIETLFERFDIARSGDDVHDLRKLVLDLALENGALFDKLAELEGIKRAKKKLR